MVSKYLNTVDIFDKILINLESDDIHTKGYVFLELLPYYDADKYFKESKNEF